MTNQDFYLRLKGIIWFISFASVRPLFYSISLHKENNESLLQMVNESVIAVKQVLNYRSGLLVDDDTSLGAIVPMCSESCTACN